MIKYRKLAEISLAIGFLTFLAGCVGAITGEVLPNSMLVGDASDFVEQHDKDGRNLAQDIADILKDRGLNVTSGRRAARPADVDYIVTYVDHWNWDMRMYLSDLRIEVRDTRTNAILGYGQSAQSSLKAMGKSHADVIVTALKQLLGP